MGNDNKVLYYDELAQLWIENVVTRINVRSDSIYE